MKAICVICNELLEAIDGICAVPCGHTFHGHCLLQWLERAKTCPQCRKKTTDRNVIKLYFDAPPTEPSQLDALDLQNQLDNYKFQLCLKDQEIKNLKDDNFLKTNQVEGLRDECRNHDRILKDKETKILALQAQINHLQHSSKRLEQAKKEAKDAHAKLQALQVLQELLDESSTDIEETLSYYCASNPHESNRKMATFIDLLTKRLNEFKKEKKMLCEDTERKRKKLEEMKSEIYEKRIECESLKKETRLLLEDKDALEREIRSKNKKISSLENAILSPSDDVAKSVISRLLRESPAPLELKSRKHTIPLMEDIVDLTPEIIRKTPRISEGQVAANSQIKSDLRNENPSPYLQIKASSMRPLLERKNFNIMAEKRRSTLQPHSLTKLAAKSSFRDHEIGYDGMGGHSKPDIFPKPSLLKMRNPTGPSKTSPKVISKRMQNGNNVTISSHSIKKFLQNPFDE